MWRIALSAVVVLVDSIILLVLGAGLSQVQTDLPEAAPVARPVAHTAHLGASLHTSHGGLVVMKIVLAVLALNVLAILFGARLPWPGANRPAAAGNLE